MHICTYSHILTHISIYMHIYICIYIYVLVYIYIFIYEYSKCKESYHKYVFVHMLWNACIFLYFSTSAHNTSTPTQPHKPHPHHQTPTTHTPCPALYIQQQPHYFWRGASSLPHPPTYISFI